MTGNPTANQYSNTWFEVFLRSVPPEQTEKEAAFLLRQLPLPRHTHIVDLCCGAGRHARLLAEQGYCVLGIDLNPRILRKAKQSCDRVEYLALDMRCLRALSGKFDAVLIMWQSFGYFDERTNEDILRQIHGKLNPGGRLVLDIYNRRFFERSQGERSLTRDGVRVVERKHVSGKRLFVSLEYVDQGAIDRFEWQVYTPEELSSLVGRVGFASQVACTDFDESAAPSPDRPRMQFVLEKIAGARQ